MTPADSEGRGILVVEDSPTQAAEARIVLESAGFRVVVARDGAAALAALGDGGHHRFDLVLTDVLMPGMTGYELCQAVKAEPAFGAIPVVLVTALNDPGDVFEGLACGADNFLLKPYQPEYLVRRIRAVLEASDSRRWATDGKIRVDYGSKTFMIDASPDRILGFLVSTFDDFLEAQRSEHASRLAEETQRLAVVAARERETAVAEQARALERSERQFRELAETAQVIPWEADIRSGLSYIGPQVEEVLGYRPSDLLGKDLWELLMLPEDRELVTLSLSSGVPSWRLEYRVRAADGRIVWLRDHATQVKGKRALRGFLFDITALKEAEESARASELLLESALDAMPQHIAVLDANGDIVAVNEAWRRFGRESGLRVPDSGVGANYLAVCRSSRAPEAARMLEQIRIVRAGGAQEEPLGYQLETPTQALWFEARVTRCPGAGALRLVVSHENVTPRRRAEQELREHEHMLRHSQKMEAVGRLAGGISHDFNNLLTAISGYSRLLVEHAPPGTPLARYASQVQKATDQAGNLTKQLLAFSRRQVLAPKAVELNAAVGEILPLLRPLLGTDVQVSTDLAEDLGCVRVDPGQLQQVLMNLAVNARDAMPAGGRLGFATDRIEVDANLAQTLHAREPGDYARLVVSDTGCGMDEETRRNIFEPFFTTKEQGKGTGLGLAMVYGIVKQSGGWVSVYSDPGQGTTFHIYLPRLAGEADAPSDQGELDELYLGQGETILVAEDEPLVRQYVVEILADHGYAVLETLTSEHALELARQRVGPLDLLLTDVMMPGLNGVELAERVRALHPGLPVLYMSGHTGQVLVERDLLASEADLLTKPFSTARLLRKIRRILESSGREAD